MDDAEQARLRAEYARRMLGQGRPKHAGRRATHLVDNLIQAQRWEFERPEARGHWAAQVKQRRKALLRYLGQMEHDDEEAALLEAVARRAQRFLDGDEDGAGLADLLRQLREVRQRREDR